MPGRRLKLYRLTASLVSSMTKKDPEDLYIYDLEVDILDTDGKHQLKRSDTGPSRDRRLRCELTPSTRADEKCVYGMPGGKACVVDFKDYHVYHTKEDRNGPRTDNGADERREDLLTISLEMKNTDSEDNKIKVKDSEFPPPADTRSPSSRAAADVVVSELQPPTISTLSLQLIPEVKECSDIARPTKSSEYELSVQLVSMDRPVHRLMDHEGSKFKVVGILKDQKASGPDDRVRIDFGSTEFNPDGVAILVVEGDPDPKKPLPRRVDRKQAILAIDV